MFENNIVVKWPNGDLEGFCGCGFDKDAAERHAVSKANNKAAILSQAYERLTAEQFKLLPLEQRKELERDWRISGQAHHSSI